MYITKTRSFGLIVFALQSFQDSKVSKNAAQKIFQSKIIETRFASISIALAVQEIIFGAPVTQSH